MIPVHSAQTTARVKPMLRSNIEQNVLQHQFKSKAALISLWRMKLVTLEISNCLLETLIPNRVPEKFEETLFELKMIRFIDASLKMMSEHMKSQTKNYSQDNNVRLTNEHFVQLE